MTAPLRVGIVLGSTRPGRRAETIGRWIHRLADERPELRAELLDPAAFALPLLDEPIPAKRGRYDRPHTRDWAAAVGAMDAFVFVAPEYNHSVSGALKNAIDFLFAEWKDKAAGFVGYGVDGAGSRAVEHLRLIMAEVHVAGVRQQVLLSLLDDIGPDGEPAPRPRVAAHAATMLDELLVWGRALRTVRDPARP